MRNIIAGRSPISANLNGETIVGSVFQIVFAPKGLQDLARGFNPGTRPKQSAAPCKGARPV